jgi:uncharacterized protein YdhG (YjbR/CyaY superfamily)
VIFCSKQGEIKINLPEFVKIQDIKKIVDTIFDEKLQFSVESSEAIEKI